MTAESLVAKRDQMRAAARDLEIKLLRLQGALAFADELIAEAQTEMEGEPCRP